jgi:hypothetical protein
MSAWKFQQEGILKIISKDGPLWREMQKPQIMLVKHKDYGVRKMWARLEKKSKVRR